MKKIGTLGYILLGLITTSAFAQSVPTETTTPVPTESTQPAQLPGKGKRGGKKHGHRHHKKHKKPAAEQK